MPQNVCCERVKEWEVGSVFRKMSSDLSCRSSAGHQWRGDDKEQSLAEPVGRQRDDDERDVLICVCEINLKCFYTFDMWLVICCLSMWMCRLCRSRNSRVERWDGFMPHTKQPLYVKLTHTTLSTHDALFWVVRAATPSSISVPTEVPVSWFYKPV